MPNPWDVVPREAQGDADDERIYLAVGLALSKWEILETALAGLFRVVVNAQFDPAAAAYGSIVSGASRIEMVLAAARSAPAIDASTLSEVTVLLNQVGKLSGRRNEIAHGQVTRFEGPGGVDHGRFLVPATYNSRKKHNPRKPFASDATAMDHYSYAYTSAQIRQYADHFITYSDKVWPLIEGVDAAQRRLHKELAQLRRQQ
jgi:hypothetical protein